MSARIRSGRKLPLKKSPLKKKKEPLVVSKASSYQYVNEDDEDDDDEYQDESDDLLEEEETPEDFRNRIGDYNSKSASFLPPGRLINVGQGDLIDKFLNDDDLFTDNLDIIDDDAEDEFDDEEQFPQKTSIARMLSGRPKSHIQNRRIDSIINPEGQTYARIPLPPIEDYPQEILQQIYGNRYDVFSQDSFLGDDIPDNIYDILQMKEPTNLYKIEDYDDLVVSRDVADIFTYIRLFTPETVDLDTMLKPFLPKYIPAVPDIDAFLKVPRPDTEPNILGMEIIDEPSMKQSDPVVLNIHLQRVFKTTTFQTNKVKGINEEDNIQKEIDSWINDITNLHSSRINPTVNYSMPMPDVNCLMQEWPSEFEELLNHVTLPGPDMECSLREYSDIICTIFDIPIYKSIVPSLHVLFTLFLEFKNSQHFQNLAYSQSQESRIDIRDEADILTL